MSDSDGFIEEVTEELRRDQMLAKLKRYGWIAVLAVLLIVGGAAFSEYRKAQARAEAEALGDAMLGALDSPEAAERVSALQSVAASDPQASAVLALLTASEQLAADDLEGAVSNLNAVATSGDIPQIYRQIAQFKALTLQAETLDASARKQGFEALAAGTGSLRLLAQEQLALILVQEGDEAGAIEAYQNILSDAGVTPDLQQRALQVIVALGGEPDLGGTVTDEDNG
ncbi:tetratricopeptide repeat protein [Sulfitobacter donghicola]|uniref:Ancillary SecYEG translocon subunit/Cell division coordinator CpoB TPR domain-containing protein n=1 Tax=Sulfitobacter donghicola DSW-25 = KCTC 12864 = JCM 14565 TaxID=1300350 RepID=A0A073IXJ4_9RHOB|nr:tetratricopeptide repeat protein [Sulfitobacter donghicola]KEJ90097.1 hypothetical protein DSW25_07810 [Sulfitobacter donghicola DSW-25 = KCTC 12864 = JCM 14565]KIN66751.1 hypothetical protein Z948_454 [Sulfitobacter donghicola DSW-25 = KCTC 12864 = JCM 14565]